MKSKLAFAAVGVIALLALCSAGYCFWLMDNPLSYRWVPVVVTGFLLAIFVFVISLVAIFSILIRSRRAPPPPDVTQSGAT